MTFLIMEKPFPISTPYIGNSDITSLLLSRFYYAIRGKSEPLFSNSNELFRTQLENNNKLTRTSSILQCIIEF